MAKSWYSGSLLCAGCSRPITFSPERQDFVHISGDAETHQAVLNNPGRPNYGGSGVASYPVQKPKRK